MIKNINATNTINVKKIIVGFVAFLFGIVLCGFVNKNIFVYALCDCFKFNNEILELDTSTKDTDNMIRNKYLSEDLINRKNVANKIIDMGFDIDEAIDYVFPNLNKSIDNFAEKVDIYAVDATVKSDKNCKIQFKNEKNGLIIDKKSIKLQFLKNKNIDIETIVTRPKIKIEDIKDKFFKCGDFSTKYSISQNGRVNNIKMAVNAIDGYIIKSGETFSFNACTGNRTAENGYKSAKIIVGGKYVEGFGGGVCQVSSTLYNSSLLSGLKIVEVHPHSLPSSYVDPCFDAMVNAGSSDLKILNQTESDYIITASADGGVCRVVIYGLKPKYKIVRRSEKYQTISSDDEIVVDGKEYGLGSGEYVELSQGCDGFKARGYLDYYDGDVLIKSEKIRDNQYSPKLKVIAKG